MKLTVENILSKCNQIMHLANGDYNMANRLSELLVALGFENDMKDKWQLKGSKGRYVRRDAALRLVSERRSPESSPWHFLKDGDFPPSGEAVVVWAQRIGTGNDPSRRVLGVDTWYDGPDGGWFWSIPIAWQYIDGMGEIM